jgi:hypothetical protein
MKFTFYEFLQLLSLKLRQQDKVRHMVWSFWLTLVALSVLSVSFALALVLGLGLAKEIWDSRYGSGFCWFDMIGNVLGVAIGIFCVFFLSLVF